LITRYFSPPIIHLIARDDKDYRNNQNGGGEEFDVAVHAGSPLG
jgi:hypothetical protein